jgi:hypothetical protein
VSRGRGTRTGANAAPHACVDLTFGTPRDGSVRDEGAGVCHKMGALFANADRLKDLMDELDEIDAKCTTAEMDRILGVVNDTLHKATSMSRISISLGCVQQVCKIPEYFAMAGGMSARSPPAASNSSGGTKSAGKAKVGNKRNGAGSSSGATKGASSSGGGGPSSGASKAARTDKWPDVAGEKGPNGLERMAGGNPAGAPCSRHAKGGCPFKTCSYAH